MVRRRNWIILAALLLPSAAPILTPEELVRAGNAAFQHEEYERALDLYNQAETTITDPGLVAFNKAATLYRLGRFRDAELHYLCCLEDAREARRTQVLYNLGNALLQQALMHDTDASLLDRAIRSYDACLRDAEEDSSLARDARFNRQMANLLRFKAKPNKENPGDKPDPQDRKPDAKDDPKQRENGGKKEDTNQDGPDSRGKPTKLAPGESTEDAKVSETRRPRPGMGSLPPVPDKGELVPMSADDAEEHLDQAIARIKSARKKQRHERLALPPARRVLDW